MGPPITNYGDIYLHGQSAGENIKLCKMRNKSSSLSLLVRYTYTKKLTSEQRECRRQDRRGLNIQKADAGICFFDIYLPFHLPYVVQTITRINDFERRASHRTQSLSLVQLNNDNS